MSWGRRLSVVGAVLAAAGCQTTTACRHELTRRSETIASPTVAAQSANFIQVYAPEAPPSAAAVGAARSLPLEKSHGDIQLVGMQLPADQASASSPVVTAVGAASSAVGEDLSLDRLIAEVLAVHPSIESMSAAWQAAAQRYPQVVSLDDPMFGVTLAPASLGSRDVESAYAIEASQKLPWFGKRDLRGAVVSWETDGAGRDLEATRLKLAEMTEMAFWDYYEARGQLELNRQNAEILDAFRKNAVSRFEANLVTQQDVLQAEVEIANMQQRRLELERRDRVAAGRINVLLRRSPHAALSAPPKSQAREVTLPNEDLLATLALQHRPEVAAASARMEAEQAKLELAYKAYYPDTEVFGRYDKFWQPTSTQSDLQGQIGARINVPVYRRRLDAAVCEAMQLVAKARAEYDQTVLDVQADAQSAFEQVRESQRTVALYSEKLLPATEQNVGVARANYDNSKITFLELAIAQRQLVEARERQLQAQAELQRRAATMRRVVGNSFSIAPRPMPGDE